MHHLKSYSKTHKRLHKIHHTIQTHYHFNLLQHSFTSLASLKPLNQRDHALTNLVRTYLVKRLSRKYFDRLCTYHRYRQEKLTQMRIVFRRHMTRIIFKFFEQLRYMVEKSHAKRYIV
jgi:hypothetical protein